MRKNNHLNYSIIDSKDSLLFLKYTVVEITYKTMCRSENINSAIHIDM